MRDYPEVGDDVHVQGKSPRWHARFYLREDEYHWPARRANATIVAIEEGDEDDDEGVVTIELDKDGEEYDFDLSDFHRYIHPTPGEMGMWLIT